jgi:hypothetical protein
MFPVNKDMLLMISVACALIAIFYLYKEQQKTKLDVQKLSEAPPKQAVVVQKKPAPPTPSPDVPGADDSN